MNQQTRQEEIKTLARVILEFYKKNPEAGETVDGIIYWLARSRYDDSRDLVQAALDYMVDRGELVKKVLKEHTLYFYVEVPVPPSRS
ncbi:MAG: hypothetical protein AAF431_05010 [Pseudomonadota bacterium]